MFARPLSSHIHRDALRAVPWRPAAGIVGFFMILTVAASVQAAENDGNEANEALELLPGSSLIYAHVSNPAELTNFLLEHPVRSKLEAMPVYQTAMDSEGYRKVLGGVALAQTQLGKTWPDALQSLLGGGVHMAFDPTAQAVCILGRATDAAYLDQATGQLLEWAKFTDKQAFKEAPYGGQTIYQGKSGGAVAAFDGWIAVSNQLTAVQAVIDRHRREGGPSLADNQQLAAARATASPKHRAWVYLDLNAVRERQLAKTLFRGQADNPGAELLFGGILSNLKRTAYLTAELLAEESRLQLSLQAPHDAAWATGPREHYFGPDGKGRAVKHVRLEEEILSVTAYRDIARMWLQADDLFTVDMVDSLAEADSNLTTLFGGRDFGEDILGSLRPEVQFVVAPQAFDKLPHPAIKLPGFGLVARLKDPARMKPDLRRMYQSLVGFLNVVGAMEGNPQLDLGQEQVGKAILHTATYVPEPDEESSKAARIFFNFSPSIGFHEDLVVFSSSKALAKRVVQQATADPLPQDTQEGSPVNTRIAAKADAVQAALEANRNQLIAQNILNKGHTRAEAEVEIGTLLELVGLFKQATVQLQANDALRLDVIAELAP